MRARDVGVVIKWRQRVAERSVSAVGIAWDLRKADPYAVYDRMKFDIPVGYNGDAYDRMCIRIEEMKQSLRIIRQAMHDLPAGPHKTDVPLRSGPAARRTRVWSRPRASWGSTSSATPGPRRTGGTCARLR
jgi:NADH-quinone oxidoreductase subunit C/D